jgi:hypothetical protein
MSRSLPHDALRFLAVLSFLAVPRAARADATAADQAAAETLFNDALKLMDAGQAERACPKLLESQRLDPGIGTLLNLGICYESTGKTASSYGAFGEAAVMARNAGDKPRLADAERRAKVMEAKLSRLVIRVVADPRPAGLVVRRDGREVAEGLFEAAIPVDPGEHAIEASAPGKKAWTATVRVPKSPGSMTVDVPALEEAPIEVGENIPWWSTRRKIGVGVASAGLVGVVVGSVFGVMTLGKSSDSKAHCSPGLERCDSIGMGLQSDARTTARVADVAFAVGGAALVGGVVLFATAPSSSVSKPPAALVLHGGLASAGLLFQGAW